MFIGLDIFLDPMKFSKYLLISFQGGKSIDIPLFWALVPSSILAFVSSLLMLITSNFLWKQFNSIKVSGEIRRQFQAYKAYFIIGTLLTYILLYAYFSMDNAQTLSEMQRLFLVSVMAFVVGFSIRNLIYANGISKLLGTTTE